MTNLMPPLVLPRWSLLRYGLTGQRAALRQPDPGSRGFWNATARDWQRKRWLGGTSTLKIKIQVPAVGTRQLRLTILTEPRG